MNLIPYKRDKLIFNQCKKPVSITVNKKILCTIEKPLKKRYVQFHYVV